MQDARRTPGGTGPAGPGGAADGDDDDVRSGPPAWWPTLAVLGLALVVRLAYWRLAIPDYEPISDDAQYLEIATNIANGDGFTQVFPGLERHPTAFRPPLYPYLLGAVFAATGGPSVVWGQVLNLVLGLGVVFGSIRVGAHLGGRRAGIVAGVLVAVFPPLVFNDVVLLTEPLSLLLLLAGVLALVHERWLVAGLLTGALVLVRPSAQFLVVALVLWLWWRARGGAPGPVDPVRRGGRPSSPGPARGEVAAARRPPVLRPALLLVAGTALVVAPWLVRNRVELGEATLVTSNGFNLAALYSPQATETGAFVDPVRDGRFEAYRFAQLDEVIWQHDLQDLALRNIRANPSVVVRVTARNLAAYVEVRPDFNEGAERLDGRAPGLRPWFLPLVWANLVVGTYGFVRLRRRPEGKLLIVLAGYFALSSALLIAAPRVRAPVDLILCLASATVVAGLLRRRDAARATSRGDGPQAGAGAAASLLDRSDAPVAG